MTTATSKKNVQRSRSSAEMYAKKRAQVVRTEMSYSYEDRKDVVQFASVSSASLQSPASSSDSLGVSQTALEADPVKAKLLVCTSLWSFIMQFLFLLSIYLCS